MKTTQTQQWQAAPGRKALNEMMDRTAHQLHQHRQATPQPVMVVAAPADKRLLAENEQLKAENAKLKAELEQKRANERAAALLCEVDNREEWRRKGGGGKPLQLSYRVALTSQGMHFQDCV